MKLNVVANVSDYFAQKLDYDETTYQKFRYGFSILYYTLSKTLALIVIALALGILKEVLILMGAYCLVRLFAFGIHLNDSTKCTIIGMISFLGCTYLGIYVNFNMLSYIIISVISLILCVMYAPLPTAKRPISWRNRRKFKLLSAASIMALLILVLNLGPCTASNLIIVGIALEILKILPISSKVAEKI